MNIEKKLDQLTQAVRDDAAVRRIRRLQPAGGQGDKIFPPTYPAERKGSPPRHVFERRRIDKADVLCVLIDSVQSQANRLEEALKLAREEERLSFPVISVDFEGTDVADIGSITTLDAPHRVFDAIIRDSELKGTRFRDTDQGKRLVGAKAQNARAVFELSPTALVFGAWNSTGEGGGMGAKFPRVLVSEIVGVGVAVESDADRKVDRPSGQRTGSRIDPLGIRSGVHVFKQPNGDWTLEPPKGKTEKGVKEVKPSEVNHSNIAPSVTPLGVSVDHAQQTFVLSLAGLRRLRFGGGANADLYARTALGALGLAATSALDRVGYALRSRCDLVPEVGTPSGFEVVHANGSLDPFELELEEAFELVTAASERAASHGMRWNRDDLILKPQAKLVELVRLSREKALEGVDEEAAE